MNAGVASVLPSTIETPPIEADEEISLETAIDPASCAFVIVPTRFVVLYPVASVRLKAGVASVPPRDNEIPPNETEELESLLLTIDPAN